MTVSVHCGAQGWCTGDGSVGCERGALNWLALGRTVSGFQVGCTESQVMAPLVEEGDEVTPQLLNAILCGLLSEDREASRWVGHVLPDLHAPGFVS